jgi:hypothetical protein
MAEQRFRAEIRPTGGSAYIDLPFDVPAEFGTRGRVSVKGSIDGHGFRSSISPRQGRWYLVINREMRAAAGVGPGDVVDVVIDRDDEPRVAVAPDDLAAALAANPEAASRWETMSYSHRTQYLRWIEGAKRPETRRRRIEAAIPMIAEGLRRE